MGQVIKLNVCPHNFELERPFWERLKEKLGRETELDVVLSDSIDLHGEGELYYVNPVLALELYERGYVPVAKGKEDRLLFVALKEQKSRSSAVSVACLEDYLVPFLYTDRLDLLGSDIICRKRQSEVYEDLVEGRAAYGIVYGQALNRFPQLRTARKLSFSWPHFLMVKPKLKEKLRALLPRLKDKLEPVKEEEFKELGHVRLPVKTLSRFKRFFDIAKAIYDNPHIGILVYGDTIEYANQTLQRLLGYSEEELKSMSPDEIIEGEAARDIRITKERRLKGEYFPKFYENLKLKSRYGSSKYVLAFSETIFYEGKHAGLVFIVDRTKEVRYKKLYDALRNINQAIINVLTEEELYDAICVALTRELDIKFVWIGVPNEEGKLFKAIYACGEEQGYLSKIKIAVGEKCPEGRGPTARAFRDGKIFINPDTAANPIMEPWRDEMLKRGFLSSAAIPLEKEGKVVAVLNVYAKEPHYFDRETEKLLEELKEDISFALNKMEKLRSSLILQKAVERSDEWVMITDEDGIIEYVNDFVCTLTGYSREELVGSKPNVFRSGYQSESFYRKLWETILAGQEFNAVFVNRKKDGSLFYLEEKIIPVDIAKGTRKFIGLGRDITKEITLSEELEKLRFKDVITGLYNFTGFSFKVSEILERDPGDIYALLVLDVYNLTYINTTYGASLGDRLLATVGELLKRRFREEDLVSRVGGDEFAVFLKLKRKEDALLVEKSVEDLVKKPLRVNGKSIKVNLNGGIALYPDDGKSFSTLYEHASLALSESKREGAGVVKFYDQSIEEKARGFLKTEGLIERAVSEGLFLFYFQPYFYTSNLKVAGLEALARIRDRDGTIYNPAQFIDNLENSPFLKDFESWALEEVINKVNRWDIPISFNLSAKSFRRKEFIDKLVNVAKVWSAFMTVEITERALVENLEETKKILGELKFYGGALKVAVDDFGTGFSSLSYLGELPIDVIKIDISFTRAITEDRKKRSIVQGIVHLAHSLGIKTVAEGVETRQHLEILADIGCDMVQGFYLSKPLPTEEVDKILGVK